MKPCKPKKEKTKRKMQTIFAWFAMVNIIWYTIYCLSLLARGLAIDETLTKAWFKAWTIELGILFGIKFIGRKNDEE